MRLDLPLYRLCVAPACARSCTSLGGSCAAGSTCRLAADADPLVSAHSSGSLSRHPARHPAGPARHDVAAHGVRPLPPPRPPFPPSPSSSHSLLALSLTLLSPSSLPRSRSAAKDANLEFVYSELLKQSSPHEKSIARDLSRTFPKHAYFVDADGVGQENLCVLLLHPRRAAALNPQEEGRLTRGGGLRPQVQRRQGVLALR